MKLMNRALLLALAATFALTSCLKKDYDLPPDTTGYDPMLPVNMTIGRLKDLKLDADTALITEDWTIAAVVNADDRSGNLYKQIVVQDSTGGLAINIDAYSLYANYPVGRKVYIQLKGLVLGNNNGTPVLGGGVDETMSVLGIAGTSVNDHLVKGSTGNEVKDTVLTFEQVRTFNASTSSFFINRLVTVKGVQWADTSKVYTDPSGATSRYVLQCGDNNYVGNSAPTGTFAVRTSNYAKFRGQKLPAGNGTLHGIYTVYRTSPQLLIRDTSDVQFTDPRCGGTTPPGGGTGGSARVISLDSLRQMYSGNGIKLGAYKIKGVVISDPANGNPTGANIVIQDGNRGIVVYYGSTQSYKTGDSLLIDVTGDSLIMYKGAMELKVVGGSTTTVVASNRVVTPQIVTISTAIASYSTLEWTLIQVAGATITGGTDATFKGNKTLTDGTGSMTLYTATTASFVGQTAPTGAHAVTGILSQFGSTKQLQMRKADDVQ